MNFDCVDYSETNLNTSAPEGVLLSGLLMLDLDRPWELLFKMGVYLLYI